MNNLLKGNGTDRAWIGFQALAFGAFVMFVLTNVKPIGIGVAVAGTMLLIASRAVGSWSDPEARTQSFALGFAGLNLVVGIAARPWRAYIQVT